MSNFDEVTTQIQIKFRRVTPYGEFQDAIYLTKEEYDALTHQDIEGMKQSRVDSWISVVTAPPQETHPIEEVIGG